MSFVSIYGGRLGKSVRHFLRAPFIRNNFFVIFRSLERRPTRISSTTRSKLHLNIFLYAAYAFGVPLVIVLTGQMVEYLDDCYDSEIIKPQFGFVKCWFLCKCRLILLNLFFFSLELIDVKTPSIMNRSGSLVGLSLPTSDRIHLE